jgi:hypothetical protein
VVVMKVGIWLCEKIERNWFFLRRVFHSRSSQRRRELHPMRPAPTG